MQKAYKNITQLTLTTWSLSLDKWDLTTGAIVHAGAALGGEFAGPGVFSG